MSARVPDAIAQAIAREVSRFYPELYGAAAELSISRESKYDHLWVALDAILTAASPLASGADHQGQAEVR